MPEPGQGLQEGFVVSSAQFEIGEDQAFNGRNDLVAGEAGASTFANGGGFSVITTQRDLIVFHPPPGRGRGCRCDQRGDDHRR